MFSTFTPFCQFIEKQKNKVSSFEFRVSLTDLFWKKQSSEWYTVFCELWYKVQMKWNKTNEI